MNKEQTFLIKYGLHNFVTFARSKGRSVFFIKGLKDKSMISHAKRLIQECFDGTTDIKIVS